MVSTSWFKLWQWFNRAIFDLRESMYKDCWSGMIDTQVLGLLHHRLLSVCMVRVSSQQHSVYDSLRGMISSGT